MAIGEYILIPFKVEFLLKFKQRFPIQFTGVILN